MQHATFQRDFHPKLQTTVLIVEKNIKKIGRFRYYELEKKNFNAVRRGLRKLDIMQMSFAKYHRGFHILVVFFYVGKCVTFTMSTVLITRKT